MVIELSTLTYTCPPASVVILKLQWATYKDYRGFITAELSLVRTSDNTMWPGKIMCTAHTSEEMYRMCGKIYQKIPMGDMLFPKGIGVMLKRVEQLAALEML